MYFRLTKHVFIHIGLLFLACFSCFTPAARHFWQVFFFAALHEGCHMLAAFFLHVPVQRLTFLPYGCHLRLGKTDFFAEAKIAAAGPLGSFLLFLLLRNTAAGNINLLLCLVNLLPALPLDGGRIFRLVLWKSLGVYRGNRILRLFAIFLGIGFLFFGLSAPSVFCLSIGGLLISHAVFAPSPVPLLQKKARYPSVKVYPVYSRDSLHVLNRIYSPFYTVCFYVRDRNRYVSEEAVRRAFKENKAFTFSALLQEKNP